MRKHALVTLLVLGLLGPAAVAWACGNAVFLSGDEAAQKVSRAEGLLDEGKSKEALKELWKSEKGRYVDYEEEHLRYRAAVLSNVASMRMGETSDYTVPFFEEHAAAEPKDPSRRARLAEAYLAMHRPADAGKILEELAAKDLMPDAHAWATLARTRAAAGDDEGAATAAGRCAATAKHKRVCKLPTPPKQKQAAKKVS